MHEPPDPKKTVSRNIGELTFALRKLNKIPTPDLIRPQVPHNSPPTQELLAWAVKVYFFSALCQFRELLGGMLLLVRANYVSAVFFCCRGLFELAAHSYYVKKHLLQHVANGDLVSAWKFLFEINLGSRDVRNKLKEEGRDADYPEGPHIAKVMACFNEYFPNGHKEKQATETYSSLSEFSHPNCFAFINHFEWESDIRSLSKVSFGKPSRNLLTLCLPAACIAVISLLHSMRDLIGPLQQQELFATLEKTVNELLDHAAPIPKRPLMGQVAKQAKDLFKKFRRQHSGKTSKPQV